MWGVRVGIQVFRRKFHIYIHLDQVIVEILSCIKKKNKSKLIYIYEQHQYLVFVYCFILFLLILYHMFHENASLQLFLLTSNYVLQVIFVSLFLLFLYINFLYKPMIYYYFLIVQVRKKSVSPQNSMSLFTFS